MQQSRVFVDDWSLLEKICLVSAVQRLGENWASICEFIKIKLQEERQSDWFTAETCEAQYKQLYDENVKSSISNETPFSQIIQSLKSRCKIEGQPLEEQRNKYLTLKKIAESIAKNEIGEEQLAKYYEKALQARKDREVNRRKYQELLKKRDILKAEYEKVDSLKSPNKAEPKADSTSPVTTSPLLSSLLNNPPVIQYRPTLSTTSLVQSKGCPNQSSTSGRQTSVSNNTSSTVRRLSFPDIADLPIAETHPLQAKDSQVPEETTPVIETPPKLDAQHLEILISPNEEYLSEVDIPPEALLEVIDNLKEGTISLDKIIRDLEGGVDENSINKDDFSEVTNDETYISAADATRASEKVQQPNQSSEETGSETVENVDKIVTETLSSATIEEAVIQSNYILNDDQIGATNSELSPIIVPVHQDEVSVDSPTIENIECESTVTSTISTPVSRNVEQRETEVGKPVAGTLIEPETTEAKNTSNVPAISETADEPPKQPVNIVYSETNVNEEHKADIVDVDDTRLSSESYVTCENTSETDEVVDRSVVIESESLTTPIHIEEEPTPAETAVATSPVTEEQPVAAVDVSVAPAQFDEAAANIATVPEPVANVASNDALNDLSTVHPLVHGPSDDVGERTTAVHHEPSTLPNLVEETIDISEPKAEGTPSKRRLSVATLRRNDSRMEEEKRQLESIPENSNTKTLEQPSAEQQHELLENDSRTVTSRLENRSIKTPEKETSLSSAAVDDLEDEASKNGSLLQQNRVSRRQSRKRKSVSESGESPLKAVPKLLDAGESQEPRTPVTNKESKELEVTVKDLRHSINPYLEAELLKPKEEAQDKDLNAEVTQANEKVENENRSLDSKLPTKSSRRSSARTQSPVVKFESSSLSSPSSSDDSELAKTRRKSILLAYSRLVSHKYSNAFQRPITNKHVPGYENIIYNSMDLQTIKRKIDNRQLSTVVEFQRDVLLMLNNAKMFNQIGSQVYNMAVEVEKDTLDHLEVTVQALGEGVLRRVEKTNVEKIRKRQSLEITRKDSKLLKRPKSLNKDESVPTKKIKTEENEESEIQP